MAEVESESSRQKRVIGKRAYFDVAAFFKRKRKEQLVV
jgi:hypothetical protein